MRIRLPKTIAEPIILRWDEFFSIDAMERACRIRDCLEEEFEWRKKRMHLELVDPQWMLDKLESIAKGAGAMDISTKWYSTPHTRNHRHGFTYRVSYESAPGTKYKWVWMRSYYFTT